MSDITFALAIIFMVICLPLIIVMHYVTRWRQNREISSDDEQMLEELWELAQRVEDRVETLERIIDTNEDEKNWRTG